MSQGEGGGRPRSITDIKALQNQIEAYFESRKILDDNGDWKGEYKVPTITGLCLFLDISKETFAQYIKGEYDDESVKFSEPLKKAKLMVENWVVEYLHSNKNVTGAIFNLKNNFGWVDKTEVDNTIKNPEGETFKVEDVNKLDAQELQNRILGKLNGN